jgi:prepilin-type N-terminal cleavage/methylation domain-containing protein
MIQRNTHIAGFTLIELAIVLFIVSLLLGGMLLPFSAQMELRGRQETDRMLINARDALIGFAAVNGRMPCPAQASLATGETGVGLEATTAATGTTATTGPCGCTTSTSGVSSAGGTACDDATPGVVTGVLPWATLGLSEGDYWSNRYTYQVTTYFGRLASSQTVFGCTPSSNPSAAAFALCTSGGITVNSAVTGGTVVATGVPALVISHGKNGYGAYQQGTGGQNSTPANGSDSTENARLADQRENSDADATFISSGAIDDQLMWVPSGILMGRMLSAGKLP